MKTEFSNFDYAEPHPFFYKDSERRVQRQMKTEFSNLGYADPHPVLSKDKKKEERFSVKTTFSRDRNLLVILHLMRNT